MVSHDAGITWREAGAGLPQGRAVAIDEDDPDLIVYASRNRLHVSTNGGVFWRALAVELPEIEAVSLAAVGMRKSRSRSAGVAEYGWRRRCVLPSDGTTSTKERPAMSSAPYASPHATIRQRKEPGSGALAAVVAIMLGILVAVLGFFALLMWIDARNARDDADKAAARTSMAGHAGNDLDFHGHGRHDELRRRVAGERRRDRDGAQGVPGRAARRARRPGRKRQPRAEGHHRRRSRPASSTQPGRGPAARRAPSSTCARGSS